jgi:hypothetical protein
MKDISKSYGEILDTVNLDDTRAILFMEDGAVRFRHVCDGMYEPMIIAPALQIGNGHEIIQRTPLTIRASIACDFERGCSEHGFVTDSQWQAV